MSPSAPAVPATSAPYSSALRESQARATRRAIVAAAADLFAENGYAATTIDAVAERAGVGRKTVFASVGGKGALLALAWDWALAGDDDPVPMSERPGVQAILAERHPARIVRMWVDLQIGVGVRAAPMGAVVLAAADVDPDARALREAIRRETLLGATAFVTHLDGVGGLRSDVTVDQAADACWAMVNSMMVHLLTTERGWSPQAVGTWLATLASATLLEPDGRAGGSLAPPVRVVHEADRLRYTAWVDRHLVGTLSYETSETLRVLTRTDLETGGTGVNGDGGTGVDRDGGTGVDRVDIGDALVQAAFDDAQAAGTHRVVPVCRFVAWWLSRHPDRAGVAHGDTVP